MWRPVLKIVLTAALGSLAATILYGLMAGGTESEESVRVLLGFAEGTMIFTIPGALMLYGLRAILLERELSSPAIGGMLILVGGTVGGTALLFLSGTLEWAAVGALYGALTAIALLCVQALPLLSPAAVR
jgi:hypothetical protein